MLIARCPRLDAMTHWSVFHWFLVFFHLRHDVPRKINHQMMLCCAFNRQTIYDKQSILKLVYHFHFKLCCFHCSVDFWLLLPLLIDRKKRVTVCAWVCAPWCLCEWVQTVCTTRYIYCSSSWSFMVWLGVAWLTLTQKRSAQVTDTQRFRFLLYDFLFIFLALFIFIYTNPHTGVFSRFASFAAFTSWWFFIFNFTNQDRSTLFGVNCNFIGSHFTLTWVRVFAKKI